MISGGAPDGRSYWCLICKEARRRDHGHFELEQTRLEGFFFE